MDRETWKKKITDAAKTAGTYQPFFDSVINTLADILERRDNAQAEFEANGAVLVVEHTNRGGQTNSEQNPLLRVLNDMNRDALAYWRDLGLTPAGLKKINDAAMKKDERRSALVDALAALNNEK